MEKHHRISRVDNTYTAMRTEFARESKDQAGLQEQHEAQQQKIDDLKAQIVVLMKQAEKT